MNVINVHGEKVKIVKKTKKKFSIECK